MATSPIALDKLSTLVEASEVQAVAKDSRLYNELASIAYAINTAANTGEYRVLYGHRISDDAKKEVEGKGYKVTPHYPPETIDEMKPIIEKSASMQYIISWYEGE